MFLPQMMIMVLRQAEHSRALFNQAWEGPPVGCSMLSHGLHQVKDHLAVWTGMLLFTGWRMMNLQVLDQGLFGVVPFTTCLAIVWEVLTATGGLMHIHHVTICQMFPAFLTYEIGLTSMHPEMLSQCFGCREILFTKVAVDSMFWRLGDIKWQIPSCSSN